MQEPHFLNNIFEKTHLTKEELAIIIPKFQQVNFDKNEYLLQSGKTANHYWFIQQGFVRSYVVDTEGNDITTNFYATGDIVVDWPLSSPIR